MVSFFNLTLKTTAPQGVTLEINNGDLYTTSKAVTLTIGTSDATTTDYEMKIWGTSAASTEAAASWETYATSKSITLPDNDGLKTVSIKIRDNVLNESTAVTAQITLDTEPPIVNVLAPDRYAISKVSPANVCSFGFKVNEIFTEYKIKVVPSETSLENQGTLIPTTNGSTNITGNNASGFAADTAINCKINANDLQAASSGDGTKIVKVFAKDLSGNWSVA